MLAYFTYFFSYSFLGFLLETAYAFLIQGELASRKCYLFSMLCPVYGLGAVAIVAATAPLKQHKIMTFLIGMLVASIIEYFTDIFYREILETPFWDYSQMPLNLNGRICLLFSGIWGLLSLALVYWIHPLVERYAAKIPKGITALILAFFLVDAVLSTFLLQKYKTKNALSIHWLTARLTAK